MEVGGKEGRRERSAWGVELGIEARIVLVLTRATLRLSCRTVEHGARVIKQNRRGSFRSVDMAGLAV